MNAYKDFLVALGDSLESVLEQHEPDSSCFLCYVLRGDSCYPEKYVVAEMADRGYALDEDNEFSTKLKNRIDEIERKEQLGFSSYLAKEAGETPDDDGDYETESSIDNERRLVWLREEAERV